MRLILKKYKRLFFLWFFEKKLNVLHILFENPSKRPRTLKKLPKRPRTLKIPPKRPPLEPTNENLKFDVIPHPERRFWHVLTFLLYC